MITRTTDPELINRIANSEGVREHVHARGETMDFAPVVAERCTKTGIIFLTNGEDAVGIFEMTKLREWKVDTMFAMTCRGKRAIHTAREMIRWLSPYADRIWGVTPKANRKACLFNRLMGCVKFGEDETHDFYELRIA